MPVIKPALHHVTFNAMVWMSKPKHVPIGLRH
jgi:hypothetical protein